MRLYYDSTPTAEDPTWTRVSAIIEFPDVSCRNNMHGLCTVVLRDFEGALYATWSARDLTRMKVTDDAGTPNTIFRGYLINKKFHDRDLVLEIAGIGVELKRRSFGSEEVVNYILAKGFVKTLDADNKIHLQYKDTNDVFQDFTWTNDQWIKGDVDVGLMIKDTTAGYTTKEWDTKDPIAQVGGAVQDGDYSSTHLYLTEEEPVDYYIVRDESTTLDLVVTPTIDGLTFPTSKFIKEIEVEYSFRLYANSIGGLSSVDATAYLQIKKDTSWITIDEIKINKSGGASGYSEWVQALPIDLKECKIPWVDGEAGDNTELAKYFNDAGGNYTELKGIQLKLLGKITVGGTIDVIIDYIKVNISYHTYDVQPIMYKITDNGASWVRCAGVTNWQQMAVTVNEDAFQIGENTRKIIQDVSSNAGIEIDIIGQGIEEYTGIVRPNGDILKEWLVPTVGSAHLKVNDDVEDPDAGDLDPMSTGGADASESNTIAFGTLSDVWKVTEIKVYVYGKDDVGTNTMTVDVNFGGWLGGETWILLPDYSWTSKTWSDLGGDQLDLNDLQVKFTAANNVDATHKHYIDVVYCEITYVKTPTFSKYMARKFKGQHCNNVLKSVLTLEGAEWCEDYSNNKLKAVKKADFEDSGISLTQADYDHNWEYEDQCNQVKYVYVWGKTSFNNVTKTSTNIFAKAVDTSVSGEKSIQITDDNIFTVPEAQEIADTQLALLKDKRPSIRIPLNGINEDLELGTTVNITMARPTIGADDYPIRMIQRKKRGKTGVSTIVYAGFGETEWDEKIIKAINLATSLAQKSLSDRLTSTPYDVGVGGVNWEDVSGRVIGVENVITAELVGGQSIDNRIDALIGDITHDGLTGLVADEHVAHSGVTITAGTGLSGGGTIAANRTINCDITQYTNALAVAAVLADDAYVKIVGDVMTGNLDLGDGLLIRLGAGTPPHLQMGHSDALAKGWIRSYKNGGSFEIQGEDISGVMKDLFVGDPDVGVELYYAGNKKFETTNTGINVTGNIVVSGTVDGVDILARDHAPTVAGDLNHNDLANLNAGDVYEHISQAQKDALHAIYTNASAVQAVEDAGLVLSATKVITTADETTEFTFGKQQIGDSGNASAVFGIRGFGVADFALKQDTDFDTFLNAKTARTIEFQIAAVKKMNMTAAGLQLGAGARVNLIETVATDDDTKIPTSGAVKDLIVTHEGNPGDINHLTDVQVAALHAKQHAMDSATYHTSSDIATLNCSTSKHGFLKKLDNNALHFMNGQGNWAEPAGAGGVSEADFFAVEHIGSGNPGYIRCIRENSSIDGGDLANQYTYYNSGASDPWIMFGIPLPNYKAGYSLYVEDIILNLKTATASNYITDMYFVKWSDYDSFTTTTDGTNRTAAGQYIYAIDTNVGGLEAFSIAFQMYVSNAQALQISSVKVKYYYV